MCFQISNMMMKSAKPVFVAHTQTSQEVNKEFDSYTWDSDNSLSRIIQLLTAQSQPFQCKAIEDSVPPYCGNPSDSPILWLDKFNRYCDLKGWSQATFKRLCSDLV